MYTNHYVHTSINFFAWSLFSSCDLRFRPNLKISLAQPSSSRDGNCCENDSCDFYLLLTWRVETWLHDKILPLSSSSPHIHTEREVRNFPMTLSWATNAIYVQAQLRQKRCFMSVRSRHSHREFHFYSFLFGCLVFFRSLCLTSFSWMKGGWNIECKKNLILNKILEKISYFYIALTFSNTQCSNSLPTFSIYFLFRFKHPIYYKVKMVGEILKRTLMWYIAIHVSLRAGRINLFSYSTLELTHLGKNSYLHLFRELSEKKNFLFRSFSFNE